MKKIAISLVALAAVSTVAFANESRGDLRDSDTYFGKYATQRKAPNANAFAFAVNMGGQSSSAFERLKRLSEENEHGRH